MIHIQIRRLNFFANKEGRMSVVILPAKFTSRKKVRNKKTIKYRPLNRSIFSTVKLIWTTKKDKMRPSWRTMIPSENKPFEAEFLMLLPIGAKSLQIFTLWRTDMPMRSCFRIERSKYSKKTPYIRKGTTTIWKW